MLLVVGGGVYLGKRGRSAPEEALDMQALRALALTTLQQGLADPDAEVRRQAVEALGRSHDARHEDLLAPRLRDADPAVQLAAARAVGELGNRAAVAPLQQRLADQSPPELLATGGEALLHLGEPGGREPLLRAEQAAGAPPVQLLAALALAEANDRDAARRVEERLRSALAKEPSIAADALEILLRKARRNDKAAQTQLANLVTATTAPLSARLRAAACLLPTGDENARTLLSQVVAAPGPGQREAAQLLCDADDVSGQPVLRGVLAQTAEPLPARVAAARGLGSCGDNEDVRALAQKLRGGRSAGPLRQAEAGALLRLCSGDPTLLAEQSRGWVELALADGNPQVRAAGAAVLGDLERARVQPLVDKALHDPSAEVRQAAAASLGRSDDGATLGTLANALADDNRGVRLQVWRSIALIVQQLRDDALAKVTVPPALVEALRRSAAQAQGAEQVAAAGALLSAGDATQRPQVQKGLSSSDADAQELAVGAAAADPELRRSALVRLVEDESQSAALRTRAAIELLRAGDARGLARLRAAADQGGPQGLAAALALLSGDDARSVDAALLAQVRALLDSVEPAVRRTMVSLLARLPLSQAAALLRQLSQDADALVRAQVAQTAAQLRNRPGGRPLATAILRELVDDNDAAVRAQAAALLARVMRRSSRAAETAASSSRESHAAPAAAADGGTPRDGASGEPGGPEPAPATSAAVPAPSPDHADGDAKDQPRRSYLLITAPPDLEFQIDKQPPQTASGKPLEVAPGVHHLTHFGAQHEVAVEPGQTVAVTLSVPAVAQLVRAGMDAFEHKDLRRAKKSLEKAGSLCARKHDERATCNLLAFELSYYLARVYDAQDAWAEAMTEYEKILTPGFPGKVRAADRAAVAAASARLSPRLGRLRVSKLVGGRCQAVNLWMPPGRHRVNVGNGQYVQVRAQETIDIKGCP
jgi:HEAT repeat protein